MEVSPSTLEFKGDFLSPNTEHLTISNTTAGPLAFKVKTTAPKLYSVRPNASVIGPGSSIKVAIILQAFSQPLSKHYKCKDKFLIVSLPCSEDADASKVSEWWPELEKQNKSLLVSKKLRVNYVIGSTDEDEIEEEKSEIIDKSESTSAAIPVGSAIAGGAVASGNSVTSAAKEAANADEKELANSYKQIDQLNEKFDKTENEKEVEPVKKTDPFSGVSLPLTVILMLLAFIIGWLIF